MEKEKMFLGLDIGTNSIGYAVTDDQYQPVKFHGEPMLGVHLFDEASPSEDRKNARTARRRIDRRQYRVHLLQDLFASEIAKLDRRFFLRLKESYLFRDEAADPGSLFADDYTDAMYHRDYPTIHHLICSLMEDNPIRTHDVRLVYLACAWLIKHRGHFLLEITADSIDQIQNFDTVYRDFTAYFHENELAMPWSESLDTQQIGKILKEKAGVTKKYKKLLSFLFDGKKPLSSADDDYPFSIDKLLQLLCGKSVSVKDLFKKEEYEEMEKASLSLGDKEEDLQAQYASLGDDADLIIVCKKVYDWSILSDQLDGHNSISESKVAVYNQHKQDLKALKCFVKRYLPEQYAIWFRSEGDDSYSAYVGHLKVKQGQDVTKDTGDTDKPKDSKKRKDDFLTALKKSCKNLSVNGSDLEFYHDMLERLECGTFLPLQVNSDNRVIPHQLYQDELRRVLRNAETYLPFLSKKDDDGLTISEKIESLLTFRVPYYVGPLRADGTHAWIVRKERKITPWTFDHIVDRDASEQEFIRRMTNQCTYYPGAEVLPKASLLLQKFEVLNEINNLKINGISITVQQKQSIYNDLFMKNRKVTRKKITGYLIANGLLEKGREELLSGIDTDLHSTLSSVHEFRRLLSSGSLSPEDAETIIEHIACTEDRERLKRWIRGQFPQLSEDDVRYLASRKYSGFGRLSREFLDGGLLGVNKRGKTGEAQSILEAMWETNCNLMELLSDRFTFSENLEQIRREYAGEHPQSMQEKLEELYLSPAVKRQVYRTFDVVTDVVKALGRAPDKIFVEMGRGGTTDQKGKRTKTRRQQLMELYNEVVNEDVPQFKAALEEETDNRLQSNKLFLYYLQLGKCMYSGKPIDVSELMSSDSSRYNIEHIYPQSFVKDDSIINNLILVDSKINGEKSNTYPVNPEIQQKMRGLWSAYREKGLISEEKYRRLIRTTPFTDDEKQGFINRQLTETRQSTKAVLGLLKERFPESEIVSVKAGLVSDYRQEFKLLKSRQLNDLHHAKDAYLNIVVGNVWHERFTRHFYIQQQYNLKPEKLFGNPVVVDGEMIWKGKESNDAVKRIMEKNAIRLTMFQYRRGGKLFDLQPVKAAEGLVPLKKGLDPARYGGYNKPTASFFSAVRYRTGKKTDVMIMPVELMFRDRFLSDPVFAEEYARSTIEKILGGKKTVDEIAFPLGERILRINTVLSLDGFKVCLAGKSNGGRSLAVSPTVPLILSDEWEGYIKRLENFSEKQKKKLNIEPDPKHDGITAEKNAELYNIFKKKLEQPPYSKRPNNPLQTLVEGEKKFHACSVQEQAGVLLSILQVFGRLSGGVDFRSVGGGSQEASCKISSNISNLKKTYSDVRIIDASAAGLFEKRSVNLFDLL